MSNAELRLIRECIDSLALEGRLPADISSRDVRTEVSIDSLGIDSLGKAEFLLELEKRREGAMLSERAEELETIQDLCVSLRASTAAFGPNGDWIAFSTFERHTAAESRITIARYQPKVYSRNKDGWRFVTIDEFWDDNACWAPDGNLLYFTSNRDGFDCIYAKHINEDGQAVGELIEVRHFHGAQLSLTNVGREYLGLAAGEGRLVFNQGGRTANIQIADLTLEP